MEPAEATGPNVTLADYAARWLAGLRVRVQPSTTALYATVLRTHLLPELGAVPLQALTRSRLRAHVHGHLASGLSWNTVRTILVPLRACLASAVEDELVPVNPAAGLVRTLGPRRHVREPRAFEAADLAALLGVSWRLCPTHAPLFVLLVRTGLRIGEGLGLQWPDWDPERRALTVRRGWLDGAVGTPKSGRSRTVDVSRSAAAILERLGCQRGEHARRRDRELAALGWIFPGPLGVPWSRNAVRVAFSKACAAAGIRGRATPHTLRHTYASALLQMGTPVQYVSRQLGHASIKLTVDLYGSHLSMRCLEAVDALDSYGAAAPAHAALPSSQMAKAGDSPCPL